ncbi:TM2 domain-containing protein [Proteiniclasticum ruminis]|uniref:TM2 domain-containing protein n=1 Tax=Proteiniclasticum ruminis TaxID=398199 RepID=A0A1G8SJB1_9CLOT|nr:TM2 domain-containing protein [Proteiniclasticum ruminis]SDJ28815.1 TM2 domain-containing protein [Proteiniclasticum ruminis]
MSVVESKNCPQCGAPVDLSAGACKFCGAEIASLGSYQTQPPTPQYQNQVQPPVQQYQPSQQNVQYVQSQVSPYHEPRTYSSNKSKITAGILAIILGGIGVHKFYLGQTGKGILYLIFCWTYIPAIIGFIEGILYLTASDEKFYTKYVK